MKGSLPFWVNMCHGFGRASRSETLPWERPKTDSPKSLWLIEYWDKISLIWNELKIEKKFFKKIKVFSLLFARFHRCSNVGTCQTVAAWLVAKPVSWCGSRVRRAAACPDGSPTSWWSKPSSGAATMTCLNRQRRPLRQPRRPRETGLMARDRDFYLFGEKRIGNPDLKILSCNLPSRDTEEGELCEDGVCDRDDLSFSAEPLGEARSPLTSEASFPTPSESLPFCAFKAAANAFCCNRLISWW